MLSGTTTLASSQANDPAIVVGGHQVGVDLDTWPAKIVRALLRRHYEKSERRLVARFLDHGARVVELGTGLGSVALVLSGRTGVEDVLCIEANPDIARTAFTNFARNGRALTLRNQILVARAHASAGLRDMTLFASPYFLSSSQIRRRDDMQAVRVPAAVLEDTLEEHGANGLVIDIEGGEGGLLPDAELDGIDTVILELHPHVIGVDVCMVAVESLMRQGLRLDISAMDGDVFVFRRDTEGVAAAFEAVEGEVLRQYLAGRQHEQKGDLHKAVDSYRQAVSLIPACGAVPYALSLVIERCGALAHAAEAAGAAVEADPSNEDYLEQWANLLAIQGRDEEALGLYERAATRASDRPLFHLARAAVLDRLGRQSEAGQALTAAAALMPEIADAAGTLARFATTEELAPGEMSPEPQKVAAMDSPGFRTALAEILAERVHMRDASMALGTALRQAPDDVDLHHALILLLARPRDLRKALARVA